MCKQLAQGYQAKQSPPWLLKPAKHLTDPAHKRTDHCTAQRSVFKKWAIYYIGPQRHSPLVEGPSNRSLNRKMANPQIQWIEDYEVNKCDSHVTNC